MHFRVHLRAMLRAIQKQRGQDEVCKGQIISKAFFVFLTSPKKRTKKLKKFDFLLL